MQCAQFTYMYSMDPANILRALHESVILYLLQLLYSQYTAVHRSYNHSVTRGDGRNSQPRGCLPNVPVDTSGTDVIMHLRGFSICKSLGCELIYIV